MRAIIAWAALAMSATASAQSISSVDVTQLPEISGDSAQTRVTAIDNRPVVLQPDAVRVLDADGKSWLDARPLSLGAHPQLVSDGRQTFAVAGASVSQLSLNGDVPALKSLPNLPVSLTSVVGMPADGSLYIAGVDASGAPHLYQLSLVTESSRWSSLAAWPGGGVPTSVVSRIGALYLTVRSEDAATDRLLRWSSQAGWEERGAAPAVIVPGSVHAIGQAHILYLLRDPDGSSRLESFHTISRAWAPLPYRNGGRVDSVTALGNGVLTASVAAGRVSFENAQLASSKRGLTGLDWTIVVVYLGAMIGVGVYWYLRDRHGSASEFFLGSRAIPFWAAGVSLYATNTSSISYIAIPAKAFETDWQYMMNKLITILGLMFVAVWIVPLLRRLDLVSVFNYLEMRFHPAIRMIGSALCMAMHVGGRMSIVLFLPALAIATITGIDVVYSILIMGVCTIVYTAMGGMRAVVWTDFVQVIVLMGGALFAIGFVLYSLGGTNVYETAMAYDKTKLLNFSFDLTQPTLWGFLFLILFDVVLTFPKDQVLMQRTLATDSPKAAGRSIWMFAAIMLPGGLIFYGIGTVLFAYYKAHPERLDPLLPIDATFPLFISAELPAGLTGLIIAGIFAAAMGTLSGTINSIATLLTVDFYEKFTRNPTQQKSKRFAEWMTVVVGLVGISLALLLSRLDIHSLLDLAIEMAGLLGGGFAGAYTLGMFTRRANSAGVSIGVATAIVVTMAAWWNDLVHPYFYLAISIGTCIVVGYVASLFFPATTRSLAGLTIFKDHEPVIADGGSGPIDTQFLKTFLTVADEGSMAAAARVLNITSAAVSQQIHTLEREIGVPLIVRVGRTVRMTEQGARILLRVRELVRDFGDLRSVANESPIAGELRLGACPTVLAGMLPGILARMVGKFPHINVYIQPGYSAPLYASVEAGDLDAAFVLQAPYPLPKTCDWQLLREEPLIVLAPHHMGHRGAHDLLANEPLIRYDRNQWGGRQADEYLRKVGITPRERFEVNALNAIAVMVDRGLGVSLVPDWARPWPEGLKLARLQLPEESVPRRIGVIWSRASVRLRLVTVLLQESIAESG